MFQIFKKTPTSDQDDDNAVQYFKASIATAEKMALEENYVPANYNNIIGLVKTLDARETGVLKGADLKRKWLMGLWEESWKREASVDSLAELLLLFHWENYVEYSTGVRPDVTNDQG